MDSIRIETGLKRICVNDDPNRVICFNPHDLNFTERFYSLIRTFEEKQGEYQQRAAELDDGRADVDEHGIPRNVGAGLAFLREVCEFLRGQIDYVFGPGTAQAAFEDAMTLEMFEQFFAGITPFVQTVRSEKLAQYTPAKRTKRVMK